MNDSAAVLVLLPDDLTFRVIESCLCDAGARLFAMARSMDEALAAVEQGLTPAAQIEMGRPDVVLVQLEHLRDPATAAAVTALVGKLDLPVVYLASEAEALQQHAQTGSASHRDIACLCQARELALAIELALCRRDNARLRAALQADVASAAQREQRPAPSLTSPVPTLAEPRRPLFQSAPLIRYSRHAGGDHGITFISDNTAALLGYQPHELIANPWLWRGQLHPDDAPRVLAAMARLMESGISVEEYRLRHRDGSYRWILDTQWLSRRSSSDSAEIVGSWMDITERHAAETAWRQSELRLKSLIEGQGDLVCRYLPDGTVTFVNEAYCRYFDRPAEAFVGKTFLPLILEEDRALIYEATQSMTPDNPMINVEHRVIMADGSLRWQNWTAQAILDQSGQIVEFQAVGRDVTERRQASEEALRRSQERYAIIFHLAAIPIWEDDFSLVQQAIDVRRARGVTDFRSYFDAHPEFVLELLSRVRLIDINAAALALFGARDRDDMSRSFHKLFGPESLQAVRDLFLAFIEGKRQLEFENVHYTLRGERITLLYRVALPAPERHLNSTLLSAIDITERKRVEQQIQQLNADLTRRATELEAVNAELESFSYSVSHDLRSPLRAIDGFSKLLLDSHAASLGEEGMRFLHRIRQGSQRMAQLIDDLLGLSRTLRSSMHLEDCDLSAMAHVIVGELVRSDPGREVDVIIEPGLRAHADQTLLRVVLENLLGNAWKFTSRTPHARIELHAAERDGKLAYVVRDNGAGFDNAFVGKLFLPFQRLHAMDEFEGTGIGLATVQRIVRRHGGEVWAEGEVGAGATFTFTLS